MALSYDILVHINARCTAVDYKAEVTLLRFAVMDTKNSAQWPLGWEMLALMCMVYGISGVEKVFTLLYSQMHAEQPPLVMSILTFSLAMAVSLVALLTTFFFSNYLTL